MFNPGISPLEGIAGIALCVLGSVACVWFFMSVSFPAIQAAEKKNAEQAAADRNRARDGEAETVQMIDDVRRLNAAQQVSQRESLTSKPPYVSLRARKGAR